VSRRRPQAGLTLIEVMIASAILATMMAITWKTIANTSETRITFENFEQRNHELRMAMGRITHDFEAAYLSKNEDQNSTNPRTMFISKPASKAPEVRFSTLGHRVLWADANESEQTVISYVVRTDPATKNTIDWVRREQRRPSNQHVEDEPAEYDVIIRDMQTVKLEFWNWKNLDWQDTWDTTQSDGQKGWLPSRVKITITVKDPGGKDYKLTTQARILMQEPLNFVQ